MEINYKAKDRDRDEQFLLLFSLGIMKALKSNVISLDDSWNWLLNMRTLCEVKKMHMKKDIEKIIGLATELENVKRIIPDKYDSSCDEIISIILKCLEQYKFPEDIIDYQLDIKE